MVYNVSCSLLTNHVFYSEYHFFIKMFGVGGGGGGGGSSAFREDVGVRRGKLPLRPPSDIKGTQ